MDGKTAPALYSLAHKIVARGKESPYYHLDQYMKRYWVTPDPNQNPEQNLSARVHILERADYDEHFHDHPAESISVILHGSYIERVPIEQQQDPALDTVQFCDMIRRVGDVVYRKATDRHKIIQVDRTNQTISLFVLGPKTNQWGFYTPGGKVYWREYLNQWGDKPPADASVKAR